MELNWRTVTGDMFWPDVGDLILYEQYVGAYTTIRIGTVKQASHRAVCSSGLLVQAKYKQKEACDYTPIVTGFRWAPMEKKGE